MVSFNPQKQSTEPLSQSYEAPISENPPTKMLEIERIRQALNLNQDKTLWQVLDEGRQKSHIKMIMNPFLQKLIKGGVCPTEFMRYLVNLLTIHEALEEAQQELMKIDYLKPLVLTELFRSESLKQDLKIWEVVAAQEYVPWKPSTLSLEYAQYIRELSKSDPERIIAVIYTLYGTVMSGGQTSKRVVEQALATIRSYRDDVPQGSGVSLFEINDKGILDAAGVANFKIKWHERLCLAQKLLPLGTDIGKFHAKLIEEVSKAFDTLLNIIENNVQKGHC